MSYETAKPDTRGPLQKLLDAAGDKRKLEPIPTLEPITVMPVRVRRIDCGPFEPAELVSEPYRDPDLE